MRKISRGALRRAAKKAYKEAVKNVPRRQRMTFAAFFRDFKKSKNVDHVASVLNDEEDFDFENFINVNEISDEDVDDDKDE